MTAGATDCGVAEESPRDDARAVAPDGGATAARTVAERPAVVLLLAMPGMRPETLRVREAEGMLLVSAVGRGTFVGLDPADAEQVSTVYSHDIELDHRIDRGAIRAELDGADGVRLVLPLRAPGARVAGGCRVPQPVG